MARFGLSDLKKETNEKVERTFKRHLVVGSDLFSVATFHSLLKKFGPENVAILTDRELSKEELLTKGPNILRGEKNLNFFKEHFPETSLTEKELGSQFYKELQFRDFGGKAKPEKLLWGEEFFTEKSGEFTLEEVFSFLNDEEFLKTLSESRLDLKLVNLIQVVPEDLIENSHWKLNCTNGLIVESEHLYFGLGPAKFLSHYAEKNDLTDDFIEYCESTQTPYSLFVKFVFDEVVSDKKETILIPLSYTYEHGHFVVEFKQENGKQSLDCLVYIDPDHANEEEISRKIRLLKRQIEKIFPNAKKINRQEYITLIESSPCLNFDKELSLDDRGKMKNLKMVSVNGGYGVFGPTSLSFEDSENAPTHLMRGLLTQKFLANSL